ncbi:hypothetical protein HZ326_31104, partial [Fusarium oxysporum f. sp. albedinis]
MYVCIFFVRGPETRERAAAWPHEAAKPMRIKKRNKEQRNRRERKIEGEEEMQMHLRSASSIPSYCEVDRRSRRRDEPYSTPPRYFPAVEDMVRCFASSARASHPRVVVVESFVVNQFSWQDNAVVLFLTTGFREGNQVIRSRRWPAGSSAANRAAWEVFGSELGKDLRVPLGIDEYNHHTNGVDTGDQLRSYNQYSRPIRRGGWQS